MPNPNALVANMTGRASFKNESNDRWRSFFRILPWYAKPPKVLAN